MRKLIWMILSVISFAVFAQDEEQPPAAVQSVEPAAPANREPAQDIPGHKVTETELRVLPQLPDAQAKKDAHSIQLEVYKTIFNKDLKPDQREDVEE